MSSGSQHCVVFNCDEGRGRYSPTATSAVPNYPATRAHLSRLTAGRASSQGPVLGADGKLHHLGEAQVAHHPRSRDVQVQGAMFVVCILCVPVRRNHHATTTYQLQLSNSILQTP